MSNHSPSKKAATILQNNDQSLQAIFAKAKKLEELNVKVLPLLDEGLKKWCQVANFNGNNLIFLVANGSAATQLRFQIPDLLRKFKHDPSLASIQNIQCKVRPPITSQPDNNLNPVQPLSSESAEIIRGIAETIEDPKLKDALLRIAAHGTNKD